jgi:hypothetical protein
LPYLCRGASEPGVGRICESHNRLSELRRIEDPLGRFSEQTAVQKIGSEVILVPPPLREFLEEPIRSCRASVIPSTANFVEQYTPNPAPEL